MALERRELDYNPRKGGIMKKKENDRDLYREKEAYVVLPYKGHMKNGYRNYWYQRKNSSDQYVQW